MVDFIKGVNLAMGLLEVVKMGNKEFTILLFYYILLKKFQPIQTPPHPSHCVSLL
jgi:hypothetical protein